MSDSTREWVSAALFVAAFAWWVVAEFFIRGDPLRPSAVRFWLCVTAPRVATALLVAAILILRDTERLRRHRGLAHRVPAGAAHRGGGTAWLCETSTPSACHPNTGGSSAA